MKAGDRATTTTASRVSRRDRRQRFSWTCSLRHVQYCQCTDSVGVVSLQRIRCRTWWSHGSSQRECSNSLTSLHQRRGAGAAGFSHAREAPLQADSHSHLLVANSDSTEQEYLSLAHAWSAHQKCLAFALRRAQHGRLLPSDVAGRSL